ncbi:MAG: hypothetical protein HFE84_02165 [Lachnospiraceae bacterium]|jgi:hypothetical protein|nr:hypothetical protein [Lachnospiraceae bacterium]
MKRKNHSLIVEGILFCGSGLALLSYSLTSYAKAFNKDWGQSPYLFPLLISLAILGLSVWIIGEGILAMKKEQAEEISKKGSARQTLWVVTALILCLFYYGALAALKLPRITVGILGFSFLFSTFEIVTVLFLAAMMVFMGVRKWAVLAFVPVGTTLFLSIAFRTLLHVLLP